MTTPLIILALLFAPYFTFRLVGGDKKAELGAVIGLSLAFMFFGIGHFVKTAEMTQMLPPFVPMKEVLVYVTGIIEFSLALLLLVPQYRRLAGWLCIAAFILFFPANIYAALNYTGMGGHVWGPVYLLIRVPLQMILIGWAYWFVARGRTV